MKKLFPFSFIALIILFLTTSCKDEEPAPEPHPIIGTWVVDSYIITDLPSNFAESEGLDTQIFGEDSYTINFLDDETYSRKVEYVGPNLNDAGTWTLENDLLVLSSEDLPDNDEFTVEPETNYTNDELYISKILTASLLSDDFYTGLYDTLSRDLTIAESDSLYDLYIQEVDAKIIYIFDR